jgi:signal transduction histidine kinase
MKISKVLFRTVLLISSIIVIASVSMSIYNQYDIFKKESNYYKSDYIANKKELIKNEVEKVLEYIKYRKNLIEANTKKVLKNRVELAYITAMSIYNDNKDKKSKKEIEYMIVSALKNINFNNKSSYYFINSNSGKAILYNTQSKLNQDINIWNLKNSDGKYFVQEQSKIAKESGEGVLVNYFVKPNSNDKREYQKISYVKMFEPYDWHIGIGEYTDEMENLTKQEILNRVATIRFDKDGYIYVNRVDGYSLIFDGKKLKNPIYRGDNKLVKMIIDKSVNNKSGEYVYYKFKKLSGEEIFPKVAYVKLYEEWGWSIGAGVYIDEINKEIDRKRSELEKNITNEIIQTLFIFFCIFLVVYILSMKIEEYIHENIEQLTDSFEKASNEHKEVDKEKFLFDEFKSLGDSLNKTLKDRNEFEKRLKEANSILEHKIAEETEKRLYQERLLAQQSKMALMGEMLGAIAHQWRQPLNALAINIQNIQEVYYDEEITEEYVDDLVQTSMRQINFLSKTIDDFRGFFKKEKDEEIFCINHTIEDTLSLLSSQLNVHKIKCNINSPKEYYTKAIKNEFRQAILNIVNNAKDAIIENNKNGVIDISIDSDSHKIVIKIVDNGGGIPPHILDRVFEPYFTTKVNNKGTGIGLYMTKIIIEDNMGGKIDVSVEDDKSCFVLELPIKE